MIKSLRNSSISNPQDYRSMLAGVVPSNEYLIDTRLISNPVSSVVFENLDQYSGVYRHLQIVFSARASYTSANRTDLAMRVNGDTGSTNYGYHTLTGTGSGNAASGGEGSVSFLYFASFSSNADASGSYGAGIIEILDAFSSTKNKSFKGISGRVGVSPYASGLYSSFWKNTSPISSLTLFDLNSTNFIAGSRFSLYGVTA